MKVQPDGSARVRERGRAGSLSAREWYEAYGEAMDSGDLTKWLTARVMRARKQCKAHPGTSRTR